MTPKFNYFIPTRIIFGPGRLTELATTPYLPGKKALIVTGAGGSTKKNGSLERVIQYLKQNKVESVLFDKILSNPLVEHVMEGALIARENNCDFVIGLGGGSLLGLHSRRKRKGKAGFERRAADRRYYNNSRYR